MIATENDAPPVAVKVTYVYPPPGTEGRKRKITEWRLLMAEHVDAALRKIERDNADPPYPLYCQRAVEIIGPIA